MKPRHEALPRSPAAKPRREGQVCGAQTPTAEPLPLVGTEQGEHLTLRVGENPHLNLPVADRLAAGPPDLPFTEQLHPTAGLRNISE